MCFSFLRNGYLLTSDVWHRLAALIFAAYLGYVFSQKEERRKNALFDPSYISHNIYIYTYPC